MHIAHVMLFSHTHWQTTRFQPENSAYRPRWRNEGPLHRVKCLGSCSPRLCLCLIGGTRTKKKPLGLCEQHRLGTRRTIWFAKRASFFCVSGQCKWFVLLLYDCVCIYMDINPVHKIVCIEFVHFSELMRVYINVTRVIARYATPGNPNGAHAHGSNVSLATIRRTKHEQLLLKWYTWFECVFCTVWSITS